MTRHCATIGGPVPDPCPRGPCQDCRDELAERASLVADGCRLTQTQADVEARRQALAAMPGQRELA